MIEDEWLIKINVDTKPFEDALKLCDKFEDVTGITTAKGKFSKQYHFHYAKPYYNEMRKYLIYIDNKVKTYNLKPFSSWIVESDNGSYHKFHRHSVNGMTHIRPNKNNIATVLFLEVPEDKNKGDFYFLLKKGNDILNNTITPEKGDLLFFPWSVYHGVYPQGNGLRKTVNLDYIYA